MSESEDRYPSDFTSTTAESDILVESNPADSPTTPKAPAAPNPASGFLDRAIEIVKKAIDEDHKHNYTEAYKLYQNCLDYFMLALKYETNDTVKMLLRKKIAEYLERAEKLKAHLTSLEAKKPRPSAATNARPSGTPGGASGRDTGTGGN